jgi:hypothetical protein
LPSRLQDLPNPNYAERMAIRLGHPSVAAMVEWLNEPDDPSVGHRVVETRPTPEDELDLDERQPIPSESLG